MSDPRRAACPQRFFARALLVACALHTASRTVTAAELNTTAAFAVARDPSGQKAAAVADALLRTRLLKARTFRLVEPGRVLSGDPRTREEETLERARAAFTDGRRAYDVLKLDDSIARLGQAVQLYQQTGPLLGDVEELENALVFLGAALTLRGSVDEGESTFVELLTIDPSRQLEGFPPAVTKAFERAAQRLEHAPTGSVEIYSTPPYAAVYLDGAFVGVTPVTLNDVVAGTHYLRIEKIGYTVHGAPLEISPNQRITSHARLHSIKRGVELRDVTARATEEVVGDGMGGSLRALARMLVADTLIFVAVTQSGQDATFTGGVFDAASGSRLATERSVLSVTSTSFGADLDAFVTRLLRAADRSASSGGAGEVAPGSGGAFGLTPGSGTPSGAGSGPTYSGSTAPSLGSPSAPGSVITQSTASTPSEVYLGWTLIGVGGASIATGIVFGVLATGVHSDFKKTSQSSPDLRNIQDDGERKGLVADLTIAGGALAVIGGTIILLVSSRSTPTPEELLRNPRTAFAPEVIPTDGGAVFAIGGSLP